MQDSAAGDREVRMQGDGAAFHAIGLQLSGAPRVTSRATSGNRVVLRRGPGLSEWYELGPLGLEQGFDVAQAPAQGGIALDVNVRNATPVQAGEREVALLDGAGQVFARYGEAFAEDATGRLLPVRLVAEPGRIGIRVAARHAVFPVEIDPMVWLEQAKLTASDGAANDLFGAATALLGDTALVGAQGKGAGAAYVFTRSGTTWTQQQKLTGSDAVAGDSFGYSAALSSTTALLGACNQNGGVGAAYVFDLSGTTWTQQQKLVPSDSAEFFGFTVALSSTTAVVSASGDSSAAAGAAYVFDRSGTTWTQQQKLQGSDTVAGDYFGTATALSGDTLLVGARGRNSYTGAAYVFVRSGTTWTQQQMLQSSDINTGDWFGMSVAVSGDTALVGAHRKNSSTGAAYVFVRSGTSWTQQQKIMAAGITTNTWFGASAALQNDTALLGSYDSDQGGSVYAFTRSGTTWTQQQKIQSSDRAAGDDFGASMALDGSTALLGALGNNSKTGAAYVSVLSTPYANGQSCSAYGGLGCASTFCSDGYCCATACSGTCRTCADTPGTCTQVTSADDPDTCTGIMTCDATGACRKKNGESCAAASECASGFCADGYCCDTACGGSCDVCDATPGTCTPAALSSAGTPSCAPYACDGSSATCPTACTSDATCAAGDYCAADGTCQPQKAQAASCDDAAGKDCKQSGCRVCSTGTGHCVDGVCCDTPCTGLCLACAASLKQSGQNDGVCGPAKDNTNPHQDACPDDGAASCGHDGMCDGNGGCRLYYPAGTSCGASVCKSATVVAGQICDGSGTCATDSAGTDCSPFVCRSGACTTSCSTSSDCAPGAWCNAGQCEVKLDDGQPCTNKDACKSGIRADGVCCASGCTGQCEACNEPGTAGTCTPVAGKPRGSRPACAAGTPSAPCTQAQCDGIERTQCNGFVGSSVTCGTANCQNNTSHPAGLCDGAGHCKTPAPVDCGAYQCDTTTGQCRTTCTTADDCSGTGQCDKGKCVTGKHCKDQTTAVDPAGNATNCSPYVCASGGCLQQCTSSTDCVSGYVCDPSNKTCVRASSSAPASQGGCSCRTAGEPAQSPATLLALLALCGVAAERRRRRC